VEEIEFENRHFWNFKSHVTLTLTSDDLESHIFVNVSSTLTNITIWFVAALCLIVDVRTDVRTYGWTFLPGFIKSSLRRWHKNVLVPVDRYTSIRDLLNSPYCILSMWRQTKCSEKNLTSPPQSNLGTASRRPHWLQWDAPNSPQNCPFPLTIITPHLIYPSLNRPPHQPKRHPQCPFWIDRQTDIWDRRQKFAKSVANF